MKLQIGSIQEPKLTARASMIWMHGLGASSDDMAMLVQEMNLTDLPLRHIFVNAPIRPVTINGYFQMPAWYDIVGDKITDREDQAGILQSEQGIKEIISLQISQGISTDHLYLAGFSQGGAMALHIGLRYPQPLAGIICLSGYLPLGRSLNLQLPATNLATPIFLGSGQNDPIVRAEWIAASKMHLEHNGCNNISWHTYPIEHNVCGEELLDVKQWISRNSR